jgi:mycofactocin precursor
MEEQQDMDVVADVEVVGAVPAVCSVDLLEEELLVEEISIDGMCGVY